MGELSSTTIGERRASTGPQSNPDCWIAVVGQWRDRQGAVPLAYVDAVARAGGHARVLSTFDVLPMQDPPADLEVSTHLDPLDPSPLAGACGLILPGGGDIDPAWYHRERHPKTNKVSHRRDQFERTLLTTALERDLAVLAICHGMQMLNVCMGGTLNQHLDEDPIDHDEERPKAQPAHPVCLKPRSILAETFGRPSVPVNSAHHQAVDDLGEGLEVVAWSTDGVIEGVESTEHSWVVGVQWHPEAMAAVDEQQENLFRAFVAAAHERAALPNRRQAAGA